MVRIKICGLRRLEDIEIVNRYKPDYIGFVFADSKRKVSHKLAGQMKKNLSSDIISVGVFVDAPQDEIIKLFEDNIIEIAQLHGRESEGYINNLKENKNTWHTLLNHCFEYFIFLCVCVCVCIHTHTHTHVEQE